MKSKIKFLLNQLSLYDEDLIFEYCVEKINASKGKITIKELEKKTGYSNRWLNMKFNEKLGASPKNLSSVIRFSQCYQSFINGSAKNNFYEFYAFGIITQQNMKAAVIGENAGATTEQIMSVYPRYKIVMYKYIQRGE